MGTSPGGDKIFIVDSSESNLGSSAPRHYYGGDIQYKNHHKWGETECVPNIGLEHNPVLLLIQQTRDHCPTQMV
jgi:hypothetical protein